MTTTRSILKPVDQSLDFLVEHQPPQMHLVITTREDPQLPLARYRARGQLTELRAADLRFTPGEAAELLNQVTGLGLSVEDIAALETRTEGWIAGLQLAAISMQGHKDAAGFIQSFTGSHRFVMDYLLEEVLQQQSESIQTFLLHTSMLDRMCGPLCDAILLDPSVSGQATLEYLERSNLFIVPLDNERRWYRYHHLFGDLLRKRMEQKLTPEEIAHLHIHASEWYENNGMILEAFKHAAAANDIERAERLMEHQGDAFTPSWCTDDNIELAGVPARERAQFQARVVVEAGCHDAVQQPDNWRGRETPGNRSSFGIQNPSRHRNGRMDSQPDRENCGRQGKPRANALPGRNHPGSGAPRPGISAPRQPVLPVHGHPDYWICLLYPGRPGRGRTSLYRSPYLSPRRPGIMKAFYWHYPFGPGTGIEKPASPGG